MLLDFWQRRPVLSIVILSLFFGLAKGGYTYFEQSSRQAQLQDAQVQLVEASKELSKLQVPLTEDDVKRAIKLINLIPVDQIKAKAGSKSNGVLGHVFATARAAETGSAGFNDAWRQAGFSSIKEAMDALMSVTVANTRIVLENGLAQIHSTLNKDREPENAHLLPKKQRQALENRKRMALRPFKMFSDMIEHLNVPPGNYALVKPYHGEIQAAFKRFQS